MKAPLQLVIFIILSTVFTSCGSVPGWTTMYKSIENGQYSYYDCSSRNNTPDSIKIISTESIKSCFFNDTTKITWLLFVHMDCKQTVWQEFELYRHYSDHINFIIINDDYNPASVQKEMEKISHPIYFIDPVYSNSRTKNTRLFINELFNNKVGRDFSSNFITHNGEILEMTWDVDDEMLEKAIHEVLND